MRKPVYELMAGDVAGFILNFILAYTIFTIHHLTGGMPQENIFTWDMITFYTVLTPVGILFFMQQGHYRLSAPWWQQVKHICMFSILSLLLLGFFMYVAKGYTSRLFVLVSWLGLVPSLMIVRQLVRRYLIAKGNWDISTTIVGGYENAIETIFALKSESYVGYDIHTVILPNAREDQLEKFSEIHEGYTPVTDVPEQFERNSLVIICPDKRRELEMAEMTYKIEDSEAYFAVVPPIEGFSYYGLQPHFFFGYNIVLLTQARRLHGLLNQILKNIVDKVGATIGIIFLSPLFLYIAFKIKQDGGPVFFTHTRLGRDGRKFQCIKFRSMVMNSQEVLDDILEHDPEARAEWEADFKLKNDPRITPIGKFLRKTSLDEIPQLFNVLKGDMSLVGPRPIVEDETKYYKDRIKDYYLVRPGVTGLWQVSGRNDVSYDLRVYLDSWYVRHWSLWTDIVIVIKTIFVVALRRGAY